jgi:hypothetical protein
MKRLIYPFPHFLCDCLFMIFKEASWKWMEGLMLYHLTNFIATEHNNKKHIWKRDFSLNESILGEVQLGIKCN